MFRNDLNPAIEIGDRHRLLNRTPGPVHLSVADRTATIPRQARRPALQPARNARDRRRHARPNGAPLLIFVNARHHLKMWDVYATTISCARKRCGDRADHGRTGACSRGISSGRNLQLDSRHRQRGAGLRLLSRRVRHRTRAIAVCRKRARGARAHPSRGASRVRSARLGFDEHARLAIPHVFARAPNTPSPERSEFFGIARSDRAPNLWDPGASTHLSVRDLTPSPRAEGPRRARQRSAVPAHDAERRARPSAIPMAA